MSKTYSAQLACPQCAANYAATLYQTLWIEVPANRALVFEDRVNTATCPLCAFEAKVHAPLMCTNVPRQFAVWFEPQPSALVDDLTAQFAEAMGSGSFYATAPRITDWEEFKGTIERFEKGELKGGSASFDLEGFRRITAASAPKASFFNRLFGTK